MIRIGACGWQYLPAKGDKLRAYARLFDCVEVNTTYYHYPSLRMVNSWRRRVPSDFTFTLKAHRDISHVHEFRLVEEVYKSMEKMREYYKTLKAELLVLQLHYHSTPKKEYLEKLEEFFEHAAGYGMRLGLEARGAAWRTDRGRRILKELLSRHRVTHVFDAIYEEPVYYSDIVYSRIYGKGWHTLWVLDDDEVKEVAEKARNYSRDRLVMFMGHGVRMYTDALRVKAYLERGVLLNIYPKPGLEAVRQALMEKPVFPVTRDGLVSVHGWKVVDITTDRRVRLSKLFERIPDRVYTSVEDVLSEIRKTENL